MEPPSDQTPVGPSLPTPPSSSPDPTPTPSYPSASPAPESPAGPPEKIVDPGISQIPVSVNRSETPPPPFTPSAKLDFQPPPAAVSAQPAQSPAPQPASPPPTGIPSLPPEPGVQPVVTVGGGGLPDAPGRVFTASAPADASAGLRRKFSKKLFIPALAGLVILIGAAAFYFGYYQNPSVIYAQSLSNTGKGYLNLIDYLDKQSKLNTKGYTGSGTYSVKSSGYSTDGQIGYKNNGQNTDLTFNIGAAVTRVNADIRTIKSTGSVPDIYLKFDGIKGLGSTEGDPSLDPALAKLDGQWIVIDHTLIENLESAAGQSSANQPAMPTRDQVLDEARAFGKVDQQYVFTTAKDKAVTKVVKKYGVENVGGHKAYHYQVALQPDNVKQYILAQRDALLSSKLDAWLKQNHYETSVINSFNSAASSAKDIKSSDTFDIWMDTSHRVIYKVRIDSHPNPAENYVDIGLDYKGGDDYPFFIAGKSQDDSNSITTFSLTTDINTKTHGAGFKLTEQTGGSNGSTVSSDFNLQPNATAPTIAKPANAIQISQVLSELGFGGLVQDSGSTSSSSSSAGSTALGRNLSGAGNSATAIKSALIDGLTGH